VFGAASADQLGYSLSTADIAIASVNNYQSGTVYIIFGHSNTIPFNDIDLASSITAAGIGFQVNCRLVFFLYYTVVIKFCKFIDFWSNDKF